MVAENDPVSVDHKKAVVDAYYEAVYLANLASQKFDKEDPIYIRYFHKDDFY